MSDGVATLKQLLHADATLLALVPAARIQAGVLPQGTALPTISITSVSKVDRNLMSPDTYRHVAERVQVTVHASTYPSQKAVLRAVRKAAADKFPTVSGLVNVTVHTDSAGPDFMIKETDFESASIYIGSQDFKVTYSEQT
jgi:hypothetical protein